MSTAGKLLHDPAMVEIAHKGETADTVEQYVMHVQQAVKPELLKGLMKERGHRRVIVFCRTRSRADAYVPPPEEGRVLRRGHPLQPQPEPTSPRP